MVNQVWEHCNTIGECYEFMLAYAAQGLPSDEGNQSGGQIREYLGRAVRAISGVAENCATAIKQERIEPAERYYAFFVVLDRDSLAAIELVLAQPSISSQLVDNRMHRSISARC